MCQCHQFFDRKPIDGISCVTYRQFHQNFMNANVIFCQNVTRKKLPKILAYKKGVQKMLMKLTSGVNFINILQAAFVPIDPKSVKRYSQLN
jgi:hypothetical protein